VAGRPARRGRQIGTPPIREVPFAASIGPTLPGFMTTVGRWADRSRAMSAWS
jgi:hypothetical protein